MGIHVLPHRTPAEPPINTSGDYCRDGCWTPPGRRHGLACPAVAPYSGLPVFRALLTALPVGAAGWVLFLAFLIWSLR